MVGWFLIESSLIETRSHIFCSDTKPFFTERWCPHKGLHDTIEGEWITFVRFSCTFVFSPWRSEMVFNSFCVQKYMVTREV